MILQVPDSMARQADVSDDEMIFGLVFGLLFQGRLTLGQAGAALGISKPRMMEMLHDRGLPMPYDAADAADDLATLDRLQSRAPSGATP
jgi:predicted HTH domain antitoxin